MLKLTVDTNTLVPAVISKGNEFELLKLAQLKKINLVLSPNILKEFKDVISRPRFGFSQKQIINVLKQIINISTIVMPSSKVDIIKEDPDDNIILECAVDSGADYIVSGDRHLLNLREYKSIDIFKTTFILDILAKDK